VKLLDVNVLIYAFRKDIDQHPQYRSWLLGLLQSGEAFGVSEVALTAVVRITTNPKVFKQPSSRPEVFEFLDALLRHPLCRVVQPSTGHWEVFRKLCDQADIRGNLVTDTWFAALALENGSTWVTADRDFARFPGLRWMHPLEHQQVVENPLLD
jgi:hypothetical protein